MNIKQIIDAWRVAYNPTDIQKELAERRLQICDGCEHKTNITKSIKITHICAECGCPINKKVFTQEYDPCPLRKWTVVDTPYFTKRKSDKTLL